MNIVNFYMVQNNIIKQNKRKFIINQSPTRIKYQIYYIEDGFLNYAKKDIIIKYIGIDNYNAVKNNFEIDEYQYVYITNKKDIKRISFMLNSMYYGRRYKKPLIKKKPEKRKPLRSPIDFLLH